jgi:16S rRNA (adenine1518-N6/adenine1519-N6)-dimethyltransferase
VASGMRSWPELSVAAALRQLGRPARKRFSQSFLTDPGVCLAMAEAAALDGADEVLEIGPGLGILTRVLLERAGQVVAVELDRDLAARLPEFAPGAGLTVIEADALEFDPAIRLGPGYKLVANLPYHISSAVLFRYLFEVQRPASLVVMLQREVAERIVAPPGQASYLSTVVRAVAEVEIVRRVPAGAFYPRPKVDSAVVRIRPFAEQAIEGERLRRFRELVRAGFTQPRKTLANSLAQGLDLPRAAVEDWLRRGGLDPTSRPQQLAGDDWLRLLAVGEPDR